MDVMPGSPVGQGQIDICHYLKCPVKCISECFVAFSLQLWLLCHMTCQWGLRHSRVGCMLFNMLLLRGLVPASAQI